MAEKLFLDWFSNLSKESVPFAGGKGASLGELTRANIPVPDGFVILSTAFERFLEETDLNVELDSILGSVNHREMESIEVASEKIKALILGAKVPEDIEKEIVEGFKKLNLKFVAVRSSATSEDSSSAAWAGQLDSFLNTTKNKLIENVKRCWASLFTPRAIFYRFEKGLHETKISVAVVVQRMVESEISGIAFSVHPVTQDSNQLIIEAGFGLGEAIVSGQITPDSYVVEKAPRRIIDKNVFVQERGLFRVETGGNEWRSVKEKGGEQKLSDRQILELTEIILRIETHYGFPCDIEWAYEKEKFFIVQSRPITTLTERAMQGSVPECREDLSEVEHILRRKKEIQNVPGYILPLSSAAESTLIMQREFGIYYPYFLFQYENDATEMSYFSEDLHSAFDKLDALYKADKNFYKKAKKGFEEQFKNQFEGYLNRKKVLLYSKNDEDVFDLFSLASKIMGEGVGLAHLIEAVSMTQTHPLKERLSKKIKDPKELAKVLNAITLPEKASFLNNYQLVLKKAFAVKEKEKQLSALNKVLTEYYWIGNGYSGKKELTLKDLFAQKEQLGNVKGQDFARIRKAKKAIIRNYFLDKETVELADLLSFLTVFQDERKERILRSVDELGVVVSEVAKRTGISVKELMMLSPEEVYERKFLDPRFRQELKERAKYSLVVYFNDPAPHCKVFFGEENKKKIKHILEEKAHDNMNAIYGTCASTGKAIGRVQICKNLQEINAFEAGNVLVASMTRPEFLPAMKKSVAIITDEGGITSHAAIVARELGIPCVIGTKNATKILQNGDLVEVRANHGEVIILERAKDSLSGFKKKIELKICDSDSLSSGFNLDELKSSSLSVEHIDCRWLHLEVAAYGFTTPFLGSIVPFETVVACIKGPEMDWITDRSDHKKIFENLLEKDSKDKKFFANLHDDYSSRLKKMFLFYYENMNEDYSKFSDEKLKEKFKEIIERYTKEFVFAAFIDGFMFSADERLNELMKEFALFNKTEESANKLFSILSAPVEDSFLNEVENDLVEIVHQQSKGKKIDGLVRAHAVKYSYINSGYGGYRPYSEKEVLAKLSEKKDSEKSFPSAQNKKQKSALMKKYSFSPEVLQLVRLTELFTKWQDERKQTTQTHVCLEAKLLAVVSKRKNINLDVLLACHYFDLVGLLEGNPLNEKVLKRSKELTLCVFSKGKLVAEVNGKKALDFVSSAKGIKGANIVHIYGMTVYLGKVTGRAKIVRTFEDSKKVQEGDILVIPMTRPEHTPIMKKAAAIVTDDGGITSHAAIVSRELKKPCIVGTKIATHVLKDGDLVEVNANHAQVNILESNRLSGEKNSGFVFYESALDFAKKTEFDIQQAPCPIFLGDFVFEAYAHSRKVINVPYKMSFSFYAFFSCASSCRYAFYFFYMGSFFLQKFFVDEPLKSLSSLFILLF